MPTHTISPAYDSTATNTWTWGDSGTGQGSPSAPDTISAGWFWCPMYMGLEPGTYTVKESAVYVEWWGLGGSRLFFFVYNLSGTTWSEKITPIEVTSDIPNDGQRFRFVDSDLTSYASASARTFTVNSGDDIHIGYAFYRTGGWRQPGLESVYIEGENRASQLKYQNDGVAGDPSVLPVPLNSHSGGGSWWNIRKLVMDSNAFVLRSDTQIASQLPSTNGGIRMLPFCDSNYWVAIENFSANATNAITVNFMKVDDGTILATASFDFTLGFEKATFGIPLATRDVNLNTATSEAGNRFSCYFHINITTKSIEWFYINRDVGQGPEGTGDFALFSHTAKFDGDAANIRGTSASPIMAELPTQIEISLLSGNNAKQFYICKKPVAILGDSQSD